MKGKIFSRQEATRMLPLVRRITTDAKACCKLIDRHERAIVALRDEIDTAASAARQERVEALQAEICEHEDKLSVLREKREGCAKELEELGAFLDDPESGIVKFYGEIDSRIVYFTWKLGEPEVSFWHEIEGKYSDRQAIDGDEKVTSNAEA